MCERQHSRRGVADQISKEGEVDDGASASLGVCNTDSLSICKKHASDARSLLYRNGPITILQQTQRLVRQGVGCGQQHRVGRMDLPAGDRVRLVPAAMWLPPPELYSLPRARLRKMRPTPAAVQLISSGLCLRDKFPLANYWARSAADAADVALGRDGRMEQPSIGSQWRHT